MRNRKALFALVLVFCLLLQTCVFAAAVELPLPMTSSDGRVMIYEGQLAVPGGGGVTYRTRQSFSGDYTIDMRASVLDVGIGLMFGNGSPKPPVWVLALVEPYGMWIHYPGDWTQINKVYSPDVTKGVLADVRLQITGNTVVTSINGKEINTATLPKGTTEGPLGLFFGDTSSGFVDSVQVTQNGEVVFRDDFDFLDSEKWDIPTAIYDTNLAIGAAASANTDANAPQYFAQRYLTDGVTACGNGNFGYSSTEFPSEDLSADPAVIQLDLGRNQTFNQLILHPRNDMVSVDPAASSPSFMKDFSVLVSSDGINWSNIYTARDNPNPTGKAQGHAFEEVRARYVRLVTTKLGPMPADESGHYLQLAEIEVFCRPNLALGKTIAANNDVNVPQYFRQAYMSDGVRDCGNGNFGYSSKLYGSADIAADSNWIVVDLGVDTTFNQIVLYPRNDIYMADGGAANFPVNFELAVCSTGRLEDYVKVLTVTDGPCDSNDRDYIYNFETTTARYIWLKTNGISGKGVNETAYCVQLAEFEVYNRDAVAQQPEAQRVFHDVAYADQSNSQKLDIRLPRGEGPFPVVVYFHGGAWLIGDKGSTNEATAVLDQIVSKGYAVVNANYRFASEAKWPAQIYDCKAVIRFVRANADLYGFDPEKIAVFGSSAGGHLALMTGLTNGIAELEDLSMGNAEYSSDVSAIISNYGISDLTRWHYRENIFKDLGDPNVALLGENYTEEQALAASPVTYVSADSVPTLLCHGQNDTLVEFYHSADLAQTMEQVMDPELVETYFPAQAQHGDVNFWNTQAAVDPVLYFLQKRFEPYKLLTNGDNTSPLPEIDLTRYPNAALNLPYANNSATQKLHIITPTTGEAPYPTIVFVHGGGFASGNSANNRAIFTAGGALQALEDGYAVALVDYRCMQEARFPTPIHDVKAAIRYLRANADTYGLDSDRFAIWGESAGGYLVNMVALTNNNPAFEDLSMGNADYSSEVQACVSWYAITDLTTATNQQWTPNLMGFGAATNYEACWNASPLANVPDEVCPIYLQHGLADTAVDYEDSLYLYNEIVKKTGDTSRVKLELFPGINHATAKFLSEENVDRIVAWLDVQMPEVTQEDLDKEAAAKVDALIDAVDLADKATIDAARAAYDALTDDQKAWVTSLADLEAAERHWNTVHSVVELVLTGADKVDAADETVTYTLSGKDMHDLATVVLSFDITEDYLTDPVAEAAEGWVLMAQTWRDGKLNVALINPAGANGEGEIVTVTADIREKAGNAAVTLTYTELAAYLGTGETFVQADLTKASVSTEVRYNIFDVNKDGVVDLRDATRAQRYFGIYHADADVNRDGNVNVEDIILILNNYTDMFQ